MSDNPQLYGKCPTCSLYFALRGNGTLRHHRGRALLADGGYGHCCTGEGHRPTWIWDGSIAVPTPEEAARMATAR